MFNVYLSISILKTKRWRIVQWFPFTSTFKIDKCNAYRVKHPVSPSNIMNAERQKSKGLFAFYDQHATLFRRGITSHRIVICVLFNRFYKCAYVSFTLTIDFSWFPWSTMHWTLAVVKIEINVSLNYFGILLATHTSHLRYEKKFVNFFPEK